VGGGVSLSLFLSSLFVPFYLSPSQNHRGQNTNPLTFSLSLSTSLLTSELTNFTTRQSPDPTTHLPRPPTLTSRLRRAFSNQTGNSPLVENLGRMWEMLAAPVWDRVDEEMLGRVVGGVGLLGRRRTAGGGAGGGDEEGKKKKVGGLARRGTGGGRERMGSGDGDDLKGRGRCGSAASASSSASCSSSSSSLTSRSRSST
jgi:hypothetical protein